MKRNIIFFLIIIILFGALSGTVSVFADEDESGDVLDVQSLLTETSTLTCTYAPDCSVEPGTDEDNPVWCSLPTYQKVENPNCNVATVPQITVFTHGMAGGAHHWSNRNLNTDENGFDKFIYREDSVIFRLEKLIPQSVIYVLCLKNEEYNTAGKTGYKLTKIGCDGYYDNFNKIYDDVNEGEEPTHIEAGKHSIIILDYSQIQNEHSVNYIYNYCSN